MRTRMSTSVSFVSKRRTTSSVCWSTPTKRRSQFLNLSIRQGWLARQSGGLLTSSIVSVQFTSGRRHSETTSRSTPAGCTKTTRSSPSISRNSTNRSDVRRPTNDVNDLLGIVVFGSVARGTADRQSDIDLVVVVDGDRTSTRRIVTDAIADLHEQRFDGDRFDVEPYVESVESAHRAGSKLREISKKRSRYTVTIDSSHFGKWCLPMSSTHIEQLIDTVQAAFDRRPTDIEAGLDVDDAALLQLRKACRLLAGAGVFRNGSTTRLLSRCSKKRSVFGITEIPDFRRRRLSPSSERSSFACSNASVPGVNSVSSSMCCSSSMTSSRNCSALGSSLSAN